MKTAISVPDDLYHIANHLAKGCPAGIMRRLGLRLNLAL